MFKSKLTPISNVHNYARSYSTRNSKRIVVVGGGTAGLSIANSKVRKGYDVTLIEPSAEHYYQPLWTLVGGGISKIESSIRPNKDYIDSRINWIKKKAVTFEPEDNRVVIEGDDMISYDLLVVAAGLKTYWNRIKGLEESIGKDGVCSNYSYKYAPLTWKFLSESQGGNYLFSFPPTAVKCAGAPQKIMYLAEDFLSKNNLREKSNVSFYSAIGELFAVKHYADALNAICDKRNITRNFGHNLIEVRGDKKIAVFQKVKGITGSEDVVEVPYDFLHVTPHMGPQEFIKNSPIANNDGWVDVNKFTLQHTKYPNIFSLGDCSSLPTSKTAAAITGQSHVLKGNIESFFANRELSLNYDGYTSCPITTSSNKLLLAEFDYEKRTRESFNFDQRQESRLMFIMKERFFPFIYWNYLITGVWEGPTYLKSFMCKLMRLERIKPRID